MPELDSLRRSADRTGVVDGETICLATRRGHSQRRCVRSLRCDHERDRGQGQCSASGSLRHACALLPLLGRMLLLTFAVLFAVCVTDCLRESVGSYFTRDLFERLSEGLSALALINVFPWQTITVL